MCSQVGAVTVSPGENVMAKFESKAFGSTDKFHIVSYYKKLIKSETSCFQ